MSDERQLPPTFSAARRWGIGFHVVLGLAAALAIVGMVNYLSLRHHGRIALSEHRRIHLSPQTQRVLGALTNEVKATIFFDTRGEEQLYQLTSALLGEYAQINSRLTIRTVDPTRQPADAELLLATYQLGTLKDRNFVVLEIAGRSRVIYANELGDFQVELVSEGPPREFRKHLRSFNGEAALTTALFNLANGRRFKIGFTQGHGEHDPDRTGHPSGYAKFAQCLREQNNADIVKVSLLGTNEVPADCQLLIIAGATQLFTATELERLERFLKPSGQGGRLMALVSNPARGNRAGLEPLLARWQVAVGDRIVFDPEFAPVNNALLTAQMNQESPIVKALAADAADQRIELVLPRAVGPLRAGAASPDAPNVQWLATTSPGGLEVSEVRGGVPYPNPLADRRGVFPLMVTVEQGGLQGVTADRGSTRMVVVGDSSFLDNEMIVAAANQSFGTLAVNWLLDRPQVLFEGLVPQPVTSYRVTMTDGQLRSVEWLLLAALPGGVMVLGSLVWWCRRH